MSYLPVRSALSEISADYMSAVTLFFGYTQITTQSENVGISCAIGFALNIYYGTLYAYTPEVLPSAHRATGNGIAVACNRIMGILSAVIATVANTATSVPIFLCAALYIAMAAVAMAFPFEPYGRCGALSLRLGHRLQPIKWLTGR